MEDRDPEGKAGSKGAPGLWWVLGGLAVVLAGVGGVRLLRDSPSQESSRVTTAKALSAYLLVDPVGDAKAVRNYPRVRIDPASFPPAPAPKARPRLKQLDCPFQRIPPLMAALQARSAPRVRNLLSQGASPDACVDHGEGSAQSALQLALSNGDEELAGLLLDAGANPNAAPVNGPPPLVIAVESGSPELVGRLIAKGADVRVRSEVPLLYTAVWRGDAHLVRLLLKNGANPHSGSNGKSAWQLAKEQKDPELRKLLEEAGAGPELNDPLVVATASGSLELVRASHGSPIPALRVAIEWEEPEIARYLARSTDLDMTSNSCDVLKAAARKDDVAVLSALFQRPQVVEKRCLEEAFRLARTGQRANSGAAIILDHILKRAGPSTR